MRKMEPPVYSTYRGYGCKCKYGKYDTTEQDSHGAGGAYGGMPRNAYQIEIAVS